MSRRRRKWYGTPDLFANRVLTRDRTADLADVFGYGPSAPGWYEPAYITQHDIRVRAEHMDRHVPTDAEMRRAAKYIADQMDDAMYRTITGSPRPHVTLHCWQRAICHWPACGCDRKRGGVTMTNASIPYSDDT